MGVTRIFDILPNYLEKFPEQKVAFAAKRNKEWINYSVQEYNEKVQLISYGFLKLGLQPGDKVGVISTNRPEWNILDMAIMQLGMVSVPIYPTISQADYAHILKHSDIKLLFVEGKELRMKIEPLLPETENIKYVYTFIDQGVFSYFDQLLELERQNPQPERVREIAASVKPNDVATIIYTSGTTGVQKGVMLSHNNLIQQIMGIRDIPAKWSKRALSFLPLCHAYERLLVYLYQYLGISVYYAENIGTIAENIKEVNPNIMTAVPRVLEKFYDKLYSAGAKLGLFSKMIYYWAFSLAERYPVEESSAWYKFRHKIADKLVYRKWREAIGGEFDVVVSGGSALKKEYGAFFTAIGMPIIQGYGLSETSPVIAVMNRKKGGMKIGTVGQPLPGVEVKINKKNNEILCRGHNVMLGYYKDPELTSQIIDSDGWLHTGDTGFLDENNALTINGRLKNIFKTSFGKYVNPQTIEQLFEESNFVDAICIFGENKKFVGALILPDFVFLKEWCRRHKVQYTTPEEMVKHPDVLARYQKLVKAYNSSLADYEQVKKFTLISDDWRKMNFFTPTLKVKKNRVEKHYAEEIEKLFV